MGAHFSAAEWITESGTAPFSGCQGFLWHSYKWGDWFSHFLQYTSGLEGLACSFNNDLNYVTTVLELHPSLNL